MENKGLGATISLIEEVKKNVSTDEILDFMGSYFNKGHLRSKCLAHRKGMCHDCAIECYRSMYIGILEEAPDNVEGIEFDSYLHTFSKN